MSRVFRALVVVLVALIVSPFTAPLSSCDLTVLVTRTQPRQPTLTELRSHHVQLRGVAIVTSQSEESRRVKDDSTWRLAVPDVRSSLHEIPGQTDAVLRQAPLQRSAPLVLRI